MAESTTKRVRKPRTKKLQTPGVDEVAGSAPVTTAQVDATITTSTAEQELQHHERDKIEHQAIIEADPTVQRHAGYRPQIGDKWAGMVLTENGWVGINQE